MEKIFKKHTNGREMGKVGEHTPIIVEGFFHGSPLPFPFFLK